MDTGRKLAANRGEVVQMRTRTAAMAAAAMVAASVVAAPAVAGGDVPNREMWAQRYLSAVCPANEIADKVNAVVRREWPRRVPMRTPVTPALHRIYKWAGRVSGHTGVQLARANWPEAVKYPAARLTNEYYSRADYYRLRADSQRVTRAWLKDWNSSGNASTLIRIRLGLPPNGRGCGKYV